MSLDQGEPVPAGVTVPAPGRPAWPVFKMAILGCVAGALAGLPFGEPLALAACAAAGALLGGAAVAVLAPPGTPIRIAGGVLRANGREWPADGIAFFDMASPWSLEADQRRTGALTAALMRLVFNPARYEVRAVFSGGGTATLMRFVTRHTARQAIRDLEAARAARPPAENAAVTA
jgi:hypothetical protein